MATTVLYEVFARTANAGGHQHMGSVRAADDAEALLNARDLYSRRNEADSLWVVRSGDIIASDPDEHALLFAAAADKPFRHPGFYPVPEGAENL